MKFNDLTFEKILSYNPLHPKSDENGMKVEWVARNPDGNAIAIGETKIDCIEDARRYIRQYNEKDHR